VTLGYRIAVHDSAGGSDTRAFEVVITGANDAAVISGDIDGIARALLRMGRPLGHVSMAQFTVLRDATIQLDSCIVWANASWSGFGRDFTTPSLQADGLGKITVTRSITQTPYAGEGNRAIDPRFVDPDAGDFRLQPGVPWTGVGCFR
jgi:hypothetical protein